MSNESPVKEIEEKRARVGAHAVTLESRQRASLSGVMDVLSFNEQEILLQTTDGEISLLGEGLHIAHLSLEEGKLIVEGEIAGIEYALPSVSHVKSGSGGGIFSRLFR